MDLKQANEAN